MAATRLAMIPADGNAIDSLFQISRILPEGFWEDCYGNCMTQPMVGKHVGALSNRASSSLLLGLYCIGGSQLWESQEGYLSEVANHIKMYHHSLKKAECVSPISSSSQIGQGESINGQGFFVWFLTAMPMDCHAWGPMPRSGVTTAQQLLKLTTQVKEQKGTPRNKKKPPDLNG